MKKITEQEISEELLVKINSDKSSLSITLNDKEPKDSKDNDIWFQSI